MPVIIIKAAGKVTTCESSESQALETKIEKHVQIIEKTWQMMNFELTEKYNSGFDEAFAYLLTFFTANKFILACSLSEKRVFSQNYSIGAEY
jgi:hypothetical protein